jgi:hypothetical protein
MTNPASSTATLIKPQAAKIKQTFSARPGRSEQVVGADLSALENKGHVVTQVAASRRLAQRDIEPANEGLAYQGPSRTGICP